MDQNPTIQIQDPSGEILPTSPPASPPRREYSPPSRERVAQVVKDCEIDIQAQQKDDPVGLLLRKASRELYSDPDGTTQSHQTIIPRALLTEVLTKERIKSSLGLDTLAPEDHRSLDKCFRLVRGDGGPDELGEFAHVFAVLILTGKPKDIFRFEKNKLDDKAFPFDGGKEEESIRSRHWDKSIPDCELGWPSHFRDIFLNSQWRVFLPCFKKLEDHQTFEKSTIMPWHNYHTPRGTGSTSSTWASTDNETGPPCGGHSDVFKVFIHDGHHCFEGLNAAPGRRAYFAVKKLKTEKQADFEREVTMLRELSGHGKKEHIVQLLTTFRYDGSYCLLFPWAECDLIGYWSPRRNWNLEVTPPLIYWVASQCHGLFQALGRIHEPGSEVLDPKKDELFGRHGDIKPENILWYKGNSDSGHPLASGRLVLSDFGLSALNHKESRSKVNNKDILHTLAYAPPESILPESILPDNKISRLIDIWSLGCVYLEFVTWLLGGPRAMEDFREERMAPHLGRIQTDIYWEVQTVQDPEKGGREEHGTVVKPKVLKWIATLRTKPEATQFIQDFLDIIQNHMLVIAKSARGTAERILPLLDKIKQKCNQDPSYYTVPAPRTGDIYIPEQEPVVERFSDEAWGHIKQAKLEIPRYTGRLSERKTQEHEG